MIPLITRRTFLAASIQEAVPPDTGYRNVKSRIDNVVMAASCRRADSRDVERFGAYTSGQGTELAFIYDGRSFKVSLPDTVVTLEQLRDIVVKLNASRR